MEKYFLERYYATNFNFWYKVCIRPLTAFQYKLFRCFPFWNDCVL